MERDCSAYAVTMNQRLAQMEAERNMAPEDREELIRKAMAALRSTGITTALRERAEVVLRAIGAIQ